MDLILLQLSGAGSMAIRLAWGGSLKCVETERANVCACVNDDAVCRLDWIDFAIKDLPERSNVTLLQKFKASRRRTDFKRQVSVQTNICSCESTPLPRMLSAA